MSTPYKLIVVRPRLVLQHRPGPSCLNYNNVMSRSIPEAANTEDPHCPRWTMRVFYARLDKIPLTGSRLITLSSWPCCRCGVFVYTGCGYLDTAPWTGRGVAG